MGALVEVLQWWRSDEGELALATATAELLGAAGAQWLRARTKEEQRKCKRERGMGRSSAGGVKAKLWRVTAALGRTPAMRGHFPRHAAATV